MKEKTLLKIALISSIVGVVILYSVSQFSEIKERTIDEIYNLDDGTNIKVKGTVQKVVQTDRVVIVDIAAQNTISVFLFKNKNEVNISEGSQIEVMGEVAEQDGRKEIIGERVRVIS